MTYSPILGTLTALFEIAAGTWVLWIAQQVSARRQILRPIALLLFLLAGYQIFEVLICTGPEPRRAVLARMAFLDITWLPPVSILLMSRMLPSYAWLRKVARGALALAAVFSFWIIVDTRFITGTICQFMHAGYRYLEPYFHLYGAFYEVTQMSMIFIPAAVLPKVGDEFTRRHLGDLLIGALLFVIPSLFLAAVLPEKFDLALPSLMCHFALFFAIFLVRITLREKHYR